MMTVRMKPNVIPETSATMSSHSKLLLGRKNCSISVEKAIKILALAVVTYLIHSFFCLNVHIHKKNGIGVNKQKCMHLSIGILNGQYSMIITNDLLIGFVST